MEFLTDDWFTAFARAVEGVQLAEDRTASFVLDAGDVRSHLAVDRGRITHLGLGEPAHADVALAWSGQDAVRLAWGTLSGTAAMAATSVHTPGAADSAGPPPPMGLLDRPEAEELPEMAGATLRVQFVHPGGPLGEFGYVQEFTDGRLVREQLAIVAEADVRVKASYRAMASLRAGTQTVLEALSGGEISGEMAALASLAAIFETEEYEALRLPSAPSAAALATLGELRADPTFQAGFLAVMDETELP